MWLFLSWEIISSFKTATDRIFQHLIQPTLGAGRIAERSWIGRSLHTVTGDRSAYESILVDIFVGISMRRKFFGCLLSARVWAGEEGRLRGLYSSLVRLSTESYKWFLTLFKCKFLSSSRFGLLSDKPSRINLIYTTSQCHDTLNKRY